MRIKLPLYALILILLPSFASVANACTCGGIKPCEAYAAASVVFVGQVIKTGIKTAPGRVPANAMSTTFTSSSLAARFRIEEAFLGLKGSEIEVSGGGTTCDYEFKEGERYVVFAYRDSGIVHTTICSGTAPLTESKEALDYLRKAAKQSSGTTVLGDIHRHSNRGTSEELMSQPIADAEIILDDGKQRFRARSGPDGKFVLNGIAQGSYRVQTNPPTNSSSMDGMAEEPRNEWQLEVPPHGCVQTWFVARPEGEISGTVVDYSGVVARDLEPELIPVDEALTESNYRSVRLSDRSTFKFTFLPAGRYYLGFNLRSGPSLIEPYPEFYYPGVENRSEATIITLTEGQKILDLDLHRPLRLAERMIEGIAVWPDGRPFVRNCGISLVNPRNGYREGNCVSTDDEGRFRLKAIEGQTYNLAATLRDPKSVALISSKPLVVKVGKDNSPVKLVVEYP
jgi:hypothetical protein